MGARMDGETYTPEQVIFVGGAPRSGTTLTHALICTAEDVCDYHAEISFYRYLIQAYEHGLTYWSVHTEAFFETQDGFRDLVRELSMTTLRRAGAHLGSPKILCVKDPMLTPKFPKVAEIHGPEVRFVTVARHPDDVVRSRQEIHEKTHGPGSFQAAQVQAVAQEYLQYYALALTGEYDGRHFSFCYEDIQNIEMQQRIADFCGVPCFDTGKLWQGRQEKAGEATHSPKYGQGIDTGSRLSALPPEWSALIARICGPVMEQYGYQPRA